MTKTGSVILDHGRSPEAWCALLADMGATMPEFPGHVQFRC